jgi:hypothetical protein
MSTKPTDRLTPDNAALLLVDHQTGLANGVADQSIPGLAAMAVCHARHRGGWLVTSRSRKATPLRIQLICQNFVRRATPRSWLF